MRIRWTVWVWILAMGLVWTFNGCSSKAKETDRESLRSIVTSDTLLSGMIASLLPPNHYSVDAILPPGQCPGHYDVKLSDIGKMKKADLVVFFRGMPFMDKAGGERKRQLSVDAGGRNWMAPDSYIHGLETLANGLSKHFPEDQGDIMKRKKEAVREVEEVSKTLVEKVKGAGTAGKALIASSMQKEPLEWMGFHIVGEYGRQEAMSTREVVRLSKTGKEQQAIAVVDNLQSGPETGKGIAETLGVPHVVLTNFPSEKGYLATLGENVDAVLNAVKKK